MEIIALTDHRGRVSNIALLTAAETLHRQLRPQLPPDYAGRMALIFEAGARMAVALDGETPAGLAVYRVIENTAHGRELYVDDLATDEARRSTGVGRALLAWLEQQARTLDCGWLTLDSGTQRQQAHKFYFREGMLITSFHFAKPMA